MNIPAYMPESYLIAVEYLGKSLKKEKDAVSNLAGTDLIELATTVRYLQIELQHMRERVAVEETFRYRVKELLNE
jgi:hypothetical protein